MNKQLRFIYFLLLLSGLSIASVKAQADFASEQEFKKQAAKLFDEEQYEKAYPLYSQLLSLYRKDHNYNYRVGVCMLYASDEKERAITFLEFAVKGDKVEEEAFFYLAKAYHLNYRFDDAIDKYQAYKKLVSGAKAQRLQVDRQIEMCNNGKNLLRNITDLPVIEKTEMSREDYFRSYNISEIGGKLLVKPDEKEFRTSLDKKKNEKSILYLGSNSSQIYFSSYGNNEQRGKDIFSMKKTPSGEWGKSQLLENTINSAYDEDYPFFHPNGKVLYFCSKGHNSMGGYDIFKSTFNEETNVWGQPVNMDFPINTPDDDILYVTNADEKKAYFSSARSSVASKISVYHINVERKPIDFVIVKGNVIKNRKDQRLDVKITVKNVNYNIILGIYNTTAENGSYEIKLPNGGQFLFTVESPDFATQSEVVVVPVQTEFRPMKQEISFELPSDKLIIKSLIDESTDDSNYLLALNVIKEKSKLEVTPVTDVSSVNPATEELIPLDSETVETTTIQQNTTDNATDKTPTKLSNDDIVNIAYQDANVADTEATDLREQADIAFILANQKNDEAQNKLSEMAVLIDAASKTEDNIKKQALTDEANAAKKEAEQLNKETVAAFNIAKKIDFTAVSKRDEADLSQQYAEGLEIAVKSKNPSDALAQLEELEKKLDTINQINADRFPILSSFKREEENKKRELDKAIQESGYLKQEMADNETIISNLRADVDKTKKAQVKQGLNNQIAELINENNNKQKELEQNELKTAQLESEYNSIKNETELVNAVVEESKTGTSETVAAKVSAIDKNKLEEQVNSITAKEESVKLTETENTTIASSSTISNTDVDKAPADTVDNALATNNTSVKAYSDINKQYSADLKAANKIKDERNRENEKANVLKKWSEAIDADLAKQRQDFAATTDAKKKAKLEKRISEAEKNSKEKQAQVGQSLANVEALNQKDIVAAASIDKTNVDDNAVTTDNNTDTASNNLAENKLNDTEKQLATEETSTKTEDVKVDLLDMQADTLIAYSIDLKSKADREKNADTKKMMYEQADELLLQAKEKKIEAAQLKGTANKTEYTTNKAELDQFAKTYSTNTSDDISMADMLADEALIYFDNAEKLRLRADGIKSLDEKELVLKDAYKNEMLALEKQKKSAGIYKNHKTAVASTTENSTDNTAANTTVAQTTTENTGIATDTTIENTIDNKGSNLTNVDTSDTTNKDIVENNNTSTVANSTSTGPTISFKEINNKYKADLAAAEKITNESDREKEKADVLKKWSQAIDADVVKQKQDYAAITNTRKKAKLAKKISDAENSSKEKQIQSDQSLAKVQALEQKDALALTTPDDTTTIDNETEGQNIEKTLGRTSDESAVNEFPYTVPEAIEQIAKANALTEEANDLLAQSIVYQFETVDKTSKSVQKERKKQGEAIVKRSQDKRMQAFQLVTAANNTEFTFNQNNIEQLTKITSTNTYPDLVKAEILKDESKKYFDKAQEHRKKGNSTTSYYSKETELNAAQDNEMIALQKQKESFDMYKIYNPDFVASVEKKSASVDSNPESATTDVKPDNSDETNTSIAVNTTLPVKEDAVPQENTSEPVKAPATTTDIENETAYNEPKAIEQIQKADLLATKSEELMILSDDLKAEAVKQKNSDTKNMIYAESEEITIEAQEKKLEASQLIATANTTEYNSNQNQLDNLAKASSTNTSPDLLKAEILNDEAKKYFATAKKERIKADAATSFYIKDKELENAGKNEKIALARQKESMDIYKKYNPDLIASASKKADNTTVEKASSPVNTTKKEPVTTTTSPNTSDIVLTVNEVFEQKSVPAYTINNPIPINEKLPEGLIFKVQIGAFRKSIPQDLFQGMSPITGETTPKGFIRYTVGKFEKYTTAEKIKNKVVGLGYKDAFVVAFLNGKRIPINEAYAMAEGIPSTVLQKNTLIANPTTTVVTNPENIAKAESISAIKGLFYTVQVGVFSQPVLAAKLYNMKPLFNETTPNGYFRYYTGIYKSVLRAAEATEMVNDIGIKDAFVTAYYNGKRISIEEAKKYEMQGEGVFPKQANVNKLPYFSNASPQPELANKITIVDITNGGRSVVNNADAKQTNTSGNKNNTNSESGIIFKVQIGAFNDEVPLDIANKFLKIAKRGIKNYKDKSGLTIYTVGNLRSYDEANLLRMEVVAEDLTDAFIVAYRNGEKIPVEEARQSR